jgi:hypothetical protein
VLSLLSVALKKMSFDCTAILSLILSIALFAAPAFASISTEATNNSSITPSEYKLSKTISDSFCEAIEDGLSVKDAMDYGIDQSKWMVLGSVVMQVLTHANTEEESPALFEHATELIEKKVAKCLTAKQAIELHAYLEEGISPASEADISH